jgi:chaperone required for assembly of F1-ATPase
MSRGSQIPVKKGMERVITMALSIQKGGLHTKEPQSLYAQIKQTGKSASHRWH